jgi:hypothetical protein
LTRSARAAIITLIMANGDAGIRLSGPEMGRLSEVLREAFPDPKRLDEVLQYYLEINRANLTLETNYPARLLDILVDAKARNWTHKLIVAARQANPDNPTLAGFAQQFGLATTIGSIDNVAIDSQPRDSALEKTINNANPFLDVVKFRTGLGQMEGRVCKIELGDGGSGTGFLVGSDVVITNYHVMESVLGGTVKASDVIVRFDYKLLANNMLGGTEHRLAADWRIHESPYSDVDKADPSSGKQEPDKLDFALVRLDGRVAEEPIGGAANADPNAPPRGFVAMPAAPHDFVNSPALFILQHPDGKPLKLALDTQSVIAVNPNGTRVRYRTNTEPGSSGSPCFDADWTLVALHHLGDPKWVNPQFNQGIPFTSIVALLQAAGKGDALGEH